MKIIINTSLMVPIYEQIVDQIKMLIRNGELKENDNLPSVRTLSKELKNEYKIRGNGIQMPRHLVKNTFPFPVRIDLH